MVSDNLSSVAPSGVQSKGEGMLQTKAPRVKSPRVPLFMLNA